MSDRTNLWRTLEYLDPARFLRELRVAEERLLDTSARLGIALDPRSLRLRTQPLRPHREWRELHAGGVDSLQSLLLAISGLRADLRAIARKGNLTWLDHQDLGLELVGPAA